MERRTVVIAGGGLALVILGVAALRGRVDAAPARVKASAEAAPTAAPAAWGAAGA